MDDFGEKVDKEGRIVEVQATLQTNRFMPRTLALSASVSILLIGSATIAAVGQDESREPPIKYVLQVGDKSVPIEEGKSTSLPGTFTNPSVKLTAEPFREFTFQELRFKYPRSFTFEADLEDADAKNWTMSGNDFTLMLFSLKGKTSSKDFAETLISKFGSKNCKVVNSAAALVLDGRKLSGLTIRVSLAEHVMLMDIFEIPTKGPRTKLVTFQDSIDDDGKHSKEGAASIETFKTSFKFSP